MGHEEDRSVCLWREAGEARGRGRPERALGTTHLALYVTRGHKYTFLDACILPFYR